jgi:hypothetical protein
LSIHLLKDNSEMSLAPEFFFVSIETFWSRLNQQEWKTAFQDFLCDQT